MDTTNIDGDDLQERLSTRLLHMPGVSGVGQPGNKLTVYLVRDSDRLRTEVKAVVKSVAPSAEVAFRVTGPFSG